MSTDPSIGMMDSAYFVGRRELLDWLNDRLALNVAKIEDTCSGAVACQLVDSIFPGEVPMHKVNWTAKTDYEYINNYKVLQGVFNKLSIAKHVEVDRLCRGRYQDNLENMQWFKRFVELHATPEDYDPVARRSLGRGGAAYGRGAAARGSGSSSRTASRGATRQRSEAKARRAPREKENKPVNNATGSSSSSSSAAAGRARRVPAGRAAARDDLSRTQIAELKLTVAGLEQERDWYYSKLRDIELLLQGHENQDDATVQRIFKILYATDGENSPTASSAPAVEPPVAPVESAPVESAPVAAAAPVEVEAEAETETETQEEVVTKTAASEAVAEPEPAAEPVDVADDATF